MSDSTSCKAAEPLPKNDSRRPIRSYVIRGGRLTGSQKKALQQHWTRYVIDYKAEVFDLAAIFPQQSELVVEIGFGMGDSLLQMACENPHKNFLGIEVHRPGIGKLLHGMADQSGRADNLRIVCHDAIEVLQNCLAEQSIARVQIFFPDPWHKKRHHKRRLIQPEFVKLLVQKLRIGAALHLATDWQPYAEHMLKVLNANGDLKNVVNEGDYWVNPQRPETKFERRGLGLGHGVWDLLFERMT